MSALTPQLPTSPPTHPRCPHRYLYFSAANNRWQGSHECGSDTALVYGYASVEYPFLDTAATWICADGSTFITKTASVTCAHFPGDPLPCNAGSYSQTGRAPDGECSNSCPSDLPYSPPGSKASSACVAALSSCTRVSMEGTCAGTSIAFEDDIFKPYDGACPDTNGAQSYLNGETLM